MPIDGQEWTDRDFSEETPMPFMFPEEPSPAQNVYRHLQEACKKLEDRELDWEFNDVKLLTVKSMAASSRRPLRAEIRSEQSFGFNPRKKITVRLQIDLAGGDAEWLTGEGPYTIYEGVALFGAENGWRFKEAYKRHNGRIIDLFLENS
jgi:hypothetical protein